MLNISEHTAFDTTNTGSGTQFFADAAARKNVEGFLFLVTTGADGSLLIGVDLGNFRFHDFGGLGGSNFGGFSDDWSGFNI